MASALPSRTYGGRFHIEEEAGHGGMATIYAARDLRGDGKVALKVLRDEPGFSAEAFRQEAGLLAELRHPAIVRYIDHGVTASGEHYLAMEWLEGQTLEERLREGPLSVVEAVRLGQRVLDALAFAHERGVVHRDLKPSNLFLCGGSLAQVKILDFGIARRLQDVRRTATIGSGTPLYMSPEQANGDRALDARSDLFSLASVLVECVTGTAPFDAETPLAIMARICLEPVDLGDLAPVRLSELLSRMLAKRPEQRPPRASDLVDQLARIADDLTGDDRPPPECTPRPVLTIEQRILSAIVLLPAATKAATDAAAVAAALEEFPVRVDRFARGGMLITMLGHGTPADQASRAARCALRLQTVISRAAFAVTTGRAMIGDDLPAGDVIDRAAVLLEGQEPGAIVLDLPTAALLDRGFHIKRGATSARLLFERTEADTGRARELPCVGRERELTTLLAIFDECVAEPVARAVMVTSPAGGGKSRVRRELVQRAEARGQPFQLILGRGDSIRAGSPFALLGPALRAFAGINGSEPLAAQQDALAAIVARHFSGEAARRVTAFLGEIVRVPFDDEYLPALRSAREDPRVMADQVLIAWLDWIEAECAAGPVLLILEDLHWGDVPSVQLVDAALRTLRERPFLVVALSRPEVDVRFPGLWADRDLQRISLPPLTARSCQKLVEQLVAGLDPHKAQWIIERADGNAFYLEELARAVAGGADTQHLSKLPDTVLGMVQARFDALGRYVRRVLRAASVFGQSFSADGVSALVEDASSVEPALEVLEAREVVQAQPGSGDRQFVFRHALLRDAAYEMLTDEDRSLAHGRAGDFLETRGERNAIVLVEHFERGGVFARAIKHCEKAAIQALEANDLNSVFERVARGIRNGAQGEVLGAMRIIEAQARFWSGDYASEEVAAREAVGLTRGAARLHAGNELIAALGQQGRYAEVESVLAEARSWPEGAEHPTAWHAFLLRACAYLPWGGRMQLTEELLSEVERSAPSDPAVRGQLHKARGLMGLGIAHLADAAAHFRQSIAAFEQAGDVRLAVEARSNVVAAVGSGGQLEEAERQLRELLPMTDRINIQFLTPLLLHNLGAVRADRGDLVEGQALVERGLASARKQGDLRVQGYCAQTLAIIATRAGRFQAAEVHARAAVAATVPSLRPFAVAALAGALLGQGRTAEALAEAREANRLLEAQGYVEDGEALVRLSLVECLLAAGDRAAASEAARRAHRRLLERAEAIDEPQWRATFLDAMPDHRRTVELARTLT